MNAVSCGDPSSSRSMSVPDIDLITAVAAYSRYNQDFSTIYVVTYIDFATGQFKTKAKNWCRNSDHKDGLHSAGHESS